MITESRGFLVWRAVYAGLLLAVSLPFALFGNREVGSQPGAWLILYGVLPSLAFLAARKVNLKSAGYIAIAHDALLFAALIVLLFALPNYFALVFLAPLGGFICEGIVIWLWVVKQRSREQAIRA